MGEMPFNVRRQQLTAVYLANLMAQDNSHPKIQVLWKCWEHGKQECNSFGWIVADLAHCETRQVTVTQTV